MNWEQSMLGKYADQGFRLVEVERRPDDTIYELYFKDMPTKRCFSKLWMTAEGIQDVCRQFLIHLSGVVGAVW